MADLRRLGRPGSYRLGRLGAPPPASSPPPVHYPSFAPCDRGLAVVSLLACPLGVVIAAAGGLVVPAVCDRARVRRAGCGWAAP